MLEFRYMEQELIAVAEIMILTYPHEAEIKNYFDHCDN